MEGQRRSGRERSGAFTLVEMLVVIGILAVLLALIAVHSLPARARARQAVCVSQLRQIGLALQMYRADYDGIDSARTPDEFGFPRSPVTGLLRYAGNSVAVFWCPDAHPNDYRPDGAPTGSFESLYGFNVWDEPPGPSVPEWGVALAGRGGDFPLVYCLEHNPLLVDRAQTTRTALVARLSGAVDVVRAPWPSGSWTW